MMLVNVAAEAITAVRITFLLSSDTFCFILIIEQFAFVVLKIVFALALFAVVFVNVAATNFDVVVAVVVVLVFIFIVDVLGVCVIGANLVIGSLTKKTIFDYHFGYSIISIKIR